MRYFPLEINGAEELKKIHRVLSKKHHPDMGGNQQAFVEMQVEYEHLLKKFEYGLDDESNKDLIDELEKFRVENDYKYGWVYYKFVELAKDPVHNDFLYLAEILGYKKGWAYYKWREYEEEFGS